MDVLANRVQNLPQEIFDHIYKEVFIVPAGIQNIGLPRAYKPPHLLAIDHTSRPGYAESFCGHNTFQITRNEDETSEQLCIRWLSSLPEAHLPLLRRVLCIISTEVPNRGLWILLNYDSRLRKNKAKRLRARLKEDMSRAGLRLRQGVLRVEVHFHSNYGSEIRGVA